MEIVCPLRVTSAVPAGLGRLCCPATQPASASAATRNRIVCRILFPPPSLHHAVPQKRSGRGGTSGYDYLRRIEQISDVRNSRRPARPPQVKDLPHVNMDSGDFEITLFLIFVV